MRRAVGLLQRVVTVFFDPRIFSYLEELWCRRHEEDVTLRCDQLEFRHREVVYQVAVDDEPDLDAVVIETHDVGEDAHWKKKPRDQNRPGRASELAV